MPSQPNPFRPILAVERALDDLRRQMGIIAQLSLDSYLAVFSAEYLDDAVLQSLKQLGSPQLVLTAARAKALGLQAEGPVVIKEIHSVEQIHTLTYQSYGPVSVDTCSAAPAYSYLLALAKYASLLPALLVVEGGASLCRQPLLADWLTVAIEDIMQYSDTPQGELTEIAHAGLPLDQAGNATLYSFRTRYSSSVHLALVIGTLKHDDVPLTRIHSSCITGDVLDSLRCDCGDQLQLALSALRDDQPGVLLYLHQEGRGIGISNKLRAYRLQDQGLDTYDANIALGFDEDERDFTLAAAILKKLGVYRIRLLTNNPHKLAALKKADIEVIERVALLAEPGPHNRAYLGAKASKSGHLL